MFDLVNSQSLRKAKKQERLAVAVAAGGGGGGGDNDDEEEAEEEHEQTRLRREASEILERLFAGGAAEEDEGGSGGGGSAGGLFVDDDEVTGSVTEQEAARARAAQRALQQRFLLHSTVDFPALAASSSFSSFSTSTVAGAGAGAATTSEITGLMAPIAGGETSGLPQLPQPSQLPSPPSLPSPRPRFSSVTTWVDAADVFSHGGVRGLEAALTSLGGGGGGVGGEGGGGEGWPGWDGDEGGPEVVTAAAFFPLSLWVRLSQLFPRRYSLALPHAHEAFLVLGEGASSGGGDNESSQLVLNHLKRFGSRLVTNDAAVLAGTAAGAAGDDGSSGLGTLPLLLQGSAPALRNANSALLAQRASPYLLTSGSFLLL
jgi:hypothetical protein